LPPSPGSSIPIPLRRAAAGASGEPGLYGLSLTNTGSRLFPPLSHGAGRLHRLVYGIIPSTSMNRDASPSPTALQIARRLVAREVAPGSDAKPEVVAAALQRTCVRVSENLRDSMGEDGSNALLARALSRTEAQHPALTSIRRLNEGGIHLDGVVASVAAQGVAPVTAAVEALLASLVEILGRLVGEDMAIRLIDDEPRSRSSDGTKTP